MNIIEIYVMCLIFTILRKRNIIEMVLLWILILSTSVAALNGPEDNIPGGYLEQLRQAFERGGSVAVKTLVTDKLEEWKNIDINIAVTGNSGVGKSSFINAIRNLHDDDEGAAEVGVVETTGKVTPYRHPQNEKLVLWDLPGVGTPKFLRENYFEAIQDSRYDYFIIISADRFTENDLWLAETMRKKNKAYYFVRNKIGQDIENDKKAHKKSARDPNLIVQKIRENCMKYIHGKLGNIQETQVYLIDTFDLEKYDFNLLSARFLADAPALKREALAYSIILLSDELIRTKKEYLQDRINQVAVASGIAGAIPIPGLDVLVDIALIFHEAKFYRSQFGLDDESLRRFARKVGKSEDELQTKLNLQTKMIEFSTKGLLNYFAKIGLKMAANNVAAGVLKYILPPVGIVAGAMASYSMTHNCLTHLLNVIVEDAMRLNRYPYDKP